jgi:glycosyltransferase involved in cell wall biosynthesis
LITHLQPDAILIWNGGGLGMSLLATAEKHPRIAYYLQDMWLAPILTYRQRGGWKQFLRRGVRRVLSLPNTVVRGSHLIFVSRDLAARYQEAGVHRPNHAVVYNGVPAGMIPNDTPPRRVPTQAKILYVGQIISTKGIHVMVEALAQVRERPGLEHAELSLVGPLPDREYVEELENRINQLQLQRHIHFIPPQPRVALPEIFSQHDVFAFPVVWKEPFAITLVEALAAGIPVVSTLTGGQVEIIRDQENALVVRAGDASDLAEKLGWLLLNPDKAMRLAKAAQHDVRGKFTIELQAEGVETYLHHLLHGGELRTMGGT